MSMGITVHARFLPHDDPDASVAFYRDTLGFEVRGDAGYGGMHWITVGPPDRHVHRPVSAESNPRRHRRRTPDHPRDGGQGNLRGAFARMEASDAEVIQEPTEQPYGVRDRAFRDPAGMIRIQKLSPPVSGDEFTLTDEFSTRQRPSGRPAYAAHLAQPWLVHYPGRVRRSGQTLNPFVRTARIWYR